MRNTQLLVGFFFSVTAKTIISKHLSTCAYWSIMAGQQPENGPPAVNHSLATHN